MGIIYQLTGLIIITFIAIIVTIYILGVSLLGRALRRSAENKKKIEEENIESMGESIKELEKKPASVNDVDKKIRELNERIKKHHKQIEKIDKNPSALNVEGGIKRPCVWLIAALFLVFLAILFNELSVTQPILGTNFSALFPWLVAITIVIGIAIYEVHNLKIIEEVAITAEEAAQRSMVEAVAEAMERIDEKKISRLELSLVEDEGGEEEDSIVMTLNEIREIKFAVSLGKGNIAIHAVLHFLVEQDGLTFPEQSTFFQGEGVALPNYLTVQYKLENILPKLRKIVRLKLKAPEGPGEYILHGRLFCSDFTGPLVPFEVHVIAPIPG